MIHVLDHGMGNVGSILNMLKRVGQSGRATSDPAELSEAQKIILPGIGAFDHGMARLEDLGLIEVLNHKALDEKIPILGICLGMQVFMRSSSEGSRPGLGWIEGEVRRFNVRDMDRHGLRVPHMGWNSIEPAAGKDYFSALHAEWRFYFVHSYFVVCDSDSDVLCTTTYGVRFVSGVQHENIIGFQFHPEKSHRYGMELLKTFAEI